MTIAVMSDIHDNVWNLETALQEINQIGAEVLLFLGDFCAPFTLKQLADSFSGSIHAVLGNNDGDPMLLERIGSGYEHVTLHGQYAEITVANRTIALNHYPAIAKRIAESGKLDAVFSGHDHKKYQHRFNGTLWANPGEVMGRFGEPSFGVYNAETGIFEHVSIPV
jgi:putative phosphoesterase